jgi:osmotically-inducible protein OsmY
MSFARKVIGILSAGLVALALSACAGGSQQESTGQYVDSAAITTKVKTAIATADGLSPFSINVETYKGTVQLSGFVDTPEQRRRAEEVARGVEGVDKVVNNIRVKVSSLGAPAPAG